MVITKEILTAMKQSNAITFVKRNDGITYMICDVKIKSLNTEVKKEYEINSHVQSHKFYESLYTYESPIKTMIEHLKVDDDISIRVNEQKFDDTLTIINVQIVVTRNDKYKVYIVSSSTAKYLYQ